MTLSLRLSGGQNNSVPDGSLGGQRSDTVITDNTLHNLFDAITRSEALTGKTEYRCFYVYNDTDGTHLSGVTIEMTTNASVSHVALGLDPAGKGDGRLTGIATIIATEDTTPTGVKFFGEDIASSDGPFDTVVLPVGLLKNGECIPIWIKRVTEKGIAQEITIVMTITHDAVTLPGSDVDDGGAIGELIKATSQATGTFKIGTARIGFSNIAP